MAEDRKNPFGESESLDVPNPTGRQEDSSSLSPLDAPRPANPADGAEGNRRQETKAEKAPEKHPAEADRDDFYTVRQENDRAQRANEAWRREARRVESGRNEEVRQAWEQEDGPNGPSGKKRRPNDPRKKARKKKNKAARDDRRSFLKTLFVIVVCFVLFVTVAMMVVSNFVDSPLLAVPKRMATDLITPVQKAFSGITDSIAQYVRVLKVRGNIEYEYEQLLLKLDDYANQTAQLEELRRTNESLYDLLDEQERNRNLDPVAATVIGTDASNYFSTLTLDVGTKNGVKEYMAVVAQGGLVGVTYQVEEEKCQVRCIINSDCTVAALIQSTRDQGSVKGTLGANGEAMCRMYYLPENALTRPGDMVVTSGVGLEFPKGIPIGEVRESTRGMEENKSYVVIEPVVDFSHLEYVTVYRYKPAYAEAAQAREASFSATLEPLSTPRAVPTFQVGQVSDFIFTSTAAPETTPEAGATAAPTQTPSANESTPTPSPAGTPLPENLFYQQAPDRDETPTPTPIPTFTPAPTAIPTANPGAMTVEDE